MRRMIALLFALLVLGCVVSVYAEDIDFWILTQHYGGGSVGMFYSIYNPSDGTLILVDGGYSTNADRVKSVIEANGGKVDYWFLTHYHEDHCGAFNAIWPEYKDKIGIVYVTPLTWMDFEPYCRDWDTPETFNIFLKQTEDAENIVQLHRGDEFAIHGLRISVFNAWDDNILRYSTDVANNCSLVFKIKNKETAMLFLGDMVASGLADLMIMNYGEKIKADYVQAGHHGWGTYPMSFYQMIQAKEVFIDAQDELLSSEEYAEKHGILVKWCKDNNVPIHTYGETPFSIVLN